MVIIVIASSSHWHLQCSLYHYSIENYETDLILGSYRDGRQTPSSDGADDDDDSNDENNWRNDYPESEPSSIDEDDMIQAMAKCDIGMLYFLVCTTINNHYRWWGLSEPPWVGTTPPSTCSYCKAALLYLKGRKSWCNIMSEGWQCIGFCTHCCINRLVYLFASLLTTVEYTQPIRSPVRRRHVMFWVCLLCLVK